MKRLLRVTVWLLILCLLFSFVYAALESTHECHEEGCPICKVIAVLSLLFVAAVLPALLFVSFRYDARREDATEQDAPSGVSLVSLKVKLSD